MGFSLTTSTAAARMRVELIFLVLSIALVKGLPNPNAPCPGDVNCGLVVKRFKRSDRTIETDTRTRRLCKCPDSAPCTTKEGWVPGAPALEEHMPGSDYGYLSQPGFCGAHPEPPTCKANQTVSVSRLVLRFQFSDYCHCPAGGNLKATHDNRR